MFKITGGVVGTCFEVRGKGRGVDHNKGVGSIDQSRSYREARTVPLIDGDYISPLTGGEELAGHATCWIDEGDFDLAASAFDTRYCIVAIFFDEAVLVELNRFINDSRRVSIEDSNINLTVIVSKRLSIIAEFHLRCAPPASVAQVLLEWRMALRQNTYYHSYH